MSTMVISNSSLVAAINSLIVEMVTDSSKQLQSNVMHALNSEYNVSVHLPGGQVNLELHDPGRPPGHGGTAC